MSGGAGEVYPGVWDEGWAWEGLYRVPTQTLPGTHIELILASGPYLRPNESKIKLFMRFLR